MAVKRAIVRLNRVAQCLEDIPTFLTRDLIDATATVARAQRFSLCLCHLIKLLFSYPLSNLYYHDRHFKVLISNIIAYVFLSLEFFIPEHVLVGSLN